jgi:hypothetical protein
MAPSPTGARLEQEIDGLADLPRADLVARWRALYRGDPPKGISRRLLVLAIAYAMQAKAYGGLSPATRRRLRKAGKGPSRSKAASTHSAPRPGTRLVREWNGTTHVVDVVEGGFVWNGVRHASLSAVARAITGARWSGPRFFGLVSGETS